MIQLIVHFPQSHLDRQCVREYHHIIPTHPAVLIIGLIATLTLQSPRASGADELHVTHSGPANE